MAQGNELNKRGNLRAWMQPGGPGPTNSLKYAGQDTTYMSISGVKRPVRGGTDPQYMWDPNRIGSWNNVATMDSPPDLPAFDVEFVEKQGGIPFSHTDLTCPINFYELVGQCKSLSDFVGGWSQYVRIYPEGRAQDVDDGDRTAFNEDDMLQSKVGFISPRPIYTIGGLTFSSQSLGTLTATPVRDIIYGTAFQCQGCALPNDGTKLIYAVAKGGAAAKPIFYYSVDGGQTWSNASVATAANAEDLVALAIVGNYIVALSPTASSATQGGYYYATIDSATGIPGSFTKVTAGFVNNKQPRDMIAVGNTLWICGDGGYIYKVTDVTAGATVNNAGATTTNNLARLSGTSEVIVAVGATNSIIYSDNQGATWAAPANTPTGTLQAISVVNRYLWWVGDSSGGLYYTTNGGGTAFVTKGISGFALTSITDILHATPEVMYVAGATTTPVAKILTSYDGGVYFTNSAPRINGLPTFTGATRIAVPVGANVQVLTNNLAIAGTGVLVADGFAVLGVASVL